MDFLKRLAPAREQDASRAVAVVPSRFASVRPLRVPAVHLTSRADATRTEQEIADPDALDLAIRPGAGEGSFPIEASPPSNADEMPGLPQLRSVTEQHVAQGPDSRPSNPSPSVDAARVRPTRGAVPSGALPSVQAVPTPAGPVTRAAPPMAPISAASLVARERPAQSDRTIVHVTIDRIDVRAPSPDRPAEKPAKRRNDAPRVSLAEYLRAGQPAGGGSGR